MTFFYDMIELTLQNKYYDNCIETVFIPINSDFFEMLDIGNFEIIRDILKNASDRNCYINKATLVFYHKTDRMQYDITKYFE